MAAANPSSVSACRSCRAPIVWALTTRGRRIPLDAEPYDGDDPRGLFVVSDGVAVTAEDADEHDELAPAPRHRSHFATCPNAATHRRPA